MTNIVIPFDNESPVGPPFNSDNYKKGYYELSSKAKKLGMNVYFARGVNAHIGGGVFDNCYEFVDYDIKPVGRIRASVVFDKSRYLEPDGTYPCINNKVIKKICTDKILTAQKFPKLSPKTDIVESQSQLVDLLSELDGLVVLKPIDGSAGDGVFINNADKIDIQDVNTYPVLLQQFIDSSGGMHGITKGYHDFRVGVVDGKVTYSFVRTPGPEDYRAGIATGGTLTVIDISSIPGEILKIVAAVEEIFKKYGPRMYTVDVAYDGTRFWLIELNSQPGITSEELFPKYATILQMDLLKLLQKVARK